MIVAFGQLWNGVLMKKGKTLNIMYEMEEAGVDLFCFLFLFSFKNR
jgi:hypothetical protein